MRQTLIMTPAYAHQYGLSEWRWGGKTSSGGGFVQAIFLGRKSRGSVAFVNPRFSGGNHIDRRRFFKGILCSIKASLAERFVLVLRCNLEKNERR